jgi:hypothetical protein
MSLAHNILPHYRILFILMVIDQNYCQNPRQSFQCILIQMDLLLETKSLSRLRTIMINLLFLEFLVIIHFPWAFQEPMLDQLLHHFHRHLLLKIILSLFVFSFHKLLHTHIHLHPYIHLHCIHLHFIHLHCILYHNMNHHIHPMNPRIHPHMNPHNILPNLHPHNIYSHNMNPHPHIHLHINLHFILLEGIRMNVLLSHQFQRRLQHCWLK